MICVQSRYRGRKTRRLVKNIFVHLPRELQDIIQFYMNASVISSINKLMKKYLVQIAQFQIVYNKDEINWYKHVFQLIVKYREIITISALDFEWINFVANRKL